MANSHDSSSGDIHLAGEVLDHPWHVCAFFNDREESYRVLLPFIQEGFEQGHRAVHILDPREREEHLRRLEQAGIDIATAEQADQLVIQSWDNRYLEDGYFDADRQLAQIERLLMERSTRGFERTRLIGRMEWAVKNRPGVEQIVEYEVRLNETLPNHNDVVCCTYDLSKFSASVIIDILRVHPFVLIGEVLHRNAFFVSPEQLLQEVRERAGRHDTDID